MSNTAQKKQVFSVSSRYEEVFDILSGVDNKSEFICQAIIEKAGGINSLDDAALEKKIRKVLKEYIADDSLFIVSGSRGNVSPVVNVTEEKPRVTIEPIVQKSSDDDDSDYLRDVLNNM